MNIHEYQGKELFQSYGLDVGRQIVATTPAQVRAAQEQIGGTVVIKAQVLAGGRGKAGGVKVAKTADDAEAKGKEILDLNIKGYPVEKVLVVPAADIKQEYYVGLTLDRGEKRLILMVSAEGGVDIEELAETNPDAIKKFSIYPATGVVEAELLPELSAIFGSEADGKVAFGVVETLYKIFLEKDASLVEINPFARLGDGRLMALDAKVNFDDNALYRHEDIEAMTNREEHSEDEWDAKDSNLSFVSMDGYIGCIVNGAGLAMATMDLIKYYGAEPANFLDVGGSSNPKKVENAVRIILNNSKVKAILLNIFGGITRCDDIANGLLAAMKNQPIPVPLVIRLIGTNDEEGRAILEKAGLNATTDLDEAVKAVVAQAKG